MKNDDGCDWGWGPATPLDVTADVPSCPWDALDRPDRSCPWDALDLPDWSCPWDALDLPDWSCKPPKIKTVEMWDDLGAKEAWDVVASGRSPLNDPDLYVDKNIEWNPKIPAHLLAFFEDDTRYRHRQKRLRPSPGGPIVLGLENLVRAG